MARVSRAAAFGNESLFVADESVQGDQKHIFEIDETMAHVFDGIDEMPPLQTGFGPLSALAQQMSFAKAKSRDRDGALRLGQSRMPDQFTPYRQL